MRKPDFERNTLRALNKERPSRPALFELFLNDRYYARLAGHGQNAPEALENMKLIIDGMGAAGYEYASVMASDFHFQTGSVTREHTQSQNENPTIVDWETFEKYKWPNPEAYDYSRLDDIRGHLPEGMKLMVYGPSGVLENLIGLVGYDNLCIMLYDEPELVQTLTDHIGSRLLKYHEEAVAYDTVGFMCSNDDWGFNTQTLLSPADMRKYIFPWHKRIVETAHKNKKPCILHSCGYFKEIIDDVIEDMRFDGRHSYEDAICPVEEAYELLKGRIAVLGGIDMDFMVRKTPEEIFARAVKMLERSQEMGGYLLGTGNSVPEYVPFENYMALVRAADAFTY